ncbi:unnamed protein product [Moneuplotes crassus]|uniref:Uncharacterized protein n=1 Tax=Euplotes crassus TaxID=5936 RepID=A0AAD1X504_EUPCR|nr:unnamed protein product [Moneuplotes crassus]
MFDIPWKNVGEYIYGYPRNIRIQREKQNAKVQRIRDQIERLGKSDIIDEAPSFDSNQERRRKKMSEDFEKAPFANLKLKSNPTTMKKLLAEKMKCLKNEAKGLLRLSDWSDIYTNQFSTATISDQRGRGNSKKTVTSNVSKSLKSSPSKFSKKISFTDQSVHIRSRAPSSDLVKQSLNFDEKSPLKTNRSISLLKMFNTSIRNIKRKNKNTFNMSSTHDLAQREKLLEYSKLRKLVEVMVSKRVFALKEAKKTFKSLPKSNKSTENLLGVRAELNCLETVLEHIRNKSLHLINFQELEIYKNLESEEIHESLIKLYKFNKKHILHPMPKPLGSINDLINENNSTKPSDITLKLILKSKILPQLFSDARLKACQGLEMRTNNILY